MEVGDSMSVNEKMTAIADAIRGKTGGTSALTLDEMSEAIKTIQTGIEAEQYSWCQLPTAVKNFIDNVTYNPADYTTSQIANYAPATANINNTYPVGVPVSVESGTLDRNGYEMSVSSGTVTLVNDIPKQYTEYTVRNNGTITQVGTLKPTEALRLIKCATANVRDLGGWACDGGTVKYGKLFRGGEIAEADIDIFKNQLGIRHELNLRGLTESHEREEEWWDKSILGDDVGYTCPEQFVWHSISDTTTWKEILRCVFDCVAENKPLFFHCAAGADRTGTVACIVEAILGMSQSDIDKDYELTCFASGTGTDNSARRRNESDWKNQITAINNLTVGTTFRDKVLNWVASMGFTVDEINAFRKAMIDGTPATITLNIGTQKITNTLTNVINSNSQATITKYQPYSAEISVPDGFTIDYVKVTMGGTDITSSVFKGTKTNLYRAVTKNLTNCTVDNNTNKVIDGQGYVANILVDEGYTFEGGTITITMGGVDMSIYYSDGKIAIPNVTGDIVITATAVESAPAVETIAVTWLNGKKCGYSVGSACTVSDESSYIISEPINVEQGKKYTFSGTSPANDFGFKFVGINSNNVVTEVQDYASIKTGAFSVEWTPTSADTKQFRIRGYSSATANLQASTLTAE